jgi:hypothetical protein
MLSVVMLNVVYAECLQCALYAEYHYAECHYTQCRYAACHGAQNVLPKVDIKVGGSPVAQW